MPGIWNSDRIDSGQYWANTEHRGSAERCNRRVDPPCFLAAFSTQYPLARRGETTRSFSQRLRRFREWGSILNDSPLKTKLLKLCEKKSGFLPAYDFPHCLRTSNMIDQLMNSMDRYLFAKQYFYGTLVSAEYGFRSSCLLANFCPSTYNPIARYMSQDCDSPFKKLPGMTYHECWLQNMLIATSRQEKYRFQHKQLG